MWLDISERGELLASVEAKSISLDQVKARKFKNAKLNKIPYNVLQGEAKAAILMVNVFFILRGEFVCPVLVT